MDCFRGQSADLTLRPAQLWSLRKWGSRAIFVIAFVLSALPARAQSLVSLVPGSGQPGQTLNVAATGSGTHWVNGVTTANFGAGITVNSVTVTDATHATINITIAIGAELFTRSMTITTGGEVVFNAFGVNDTTPAVPGGAGAITASSVTTTTLTLTWAKATDNASSQDVLLYEVRRSLTNSLGTVGGAEAGTLVQAYSADIATVNVTGLAASTTYYFNVLVKDESGNKAVYATVNVTTAAPPDTVAPVPGGGGTIATSGITTTSLTLTWTKATDAVSAQSALQYEVRRSLTNSLGTVGGTEAGTLVQAYSADIATVNVTGLTASTTYYFNVLVKDVAGNKAIYASVSATTATPDTVAPVPGGGGTITASSITATGLTLTWTKANDVVSAQSALQYEIRRSLTNSLGTVGGTEAGTLVQAYSADIATVNVTGLTASTTYYFNVLVKDVAGNKAIYTSVSVATTAAPDTVAPVPGGGGAIAASAVATTSLTLTWAKATDAVSAQSALQYEIRRSLLNNIDTVVGAEAGALVQAYTTDIATVNVTALTPSTSYFFNVIVKDVAGNKAVYATVNVSTTAVPDTIAPVPGGGGTITVSSITPTSLTLTWTKATDAVSAQSALQYEIRRSFSNNMNSVGTTESVTLVQAYTADIGTASITGLDSSTPYFFNIIVKDLAGNKAIYTTVAATTSAPVLLSISPSSGSPGQTLSIDITGSGTHFVNGVTTANFGANITVNSVTVTSATFATASITIGAGVALGARTISVTTGVEVVTKTFTLAGADATPPVPGSSGAITTSSVATTSLTLTWTKATDAVSAQSALQYEVRRSTSNNISSVVNAEANGAIVQAYTADISTANMTGLTASTSYFFNVIVKDEAGNKAVYVTANATTAAAAPDTIPPVPGNSGTITTSSVTSTGLTLNWTKATDAVSAQSALQYEVRRSTINNISTVATAEANGTIIQSYMADIATANVVGLTPSTSYFFNVIVKDAAGNKAIYTTRNESTVGSSATTITLTATPSTITTGQLTTLQWVAANATTITLEPGFGNVTPTGGSLTVNPGKTTTYTATATGPGGATATSSVTVTVATATYTLPVSATQLFDVGDGTGPLTAGSVILQVTQGTDVPNGTGVLGYRQGGITLVQAAVPALPPILSGRFYAQIDDNTDIGVAFTNPGATTATITFYFTDSTGVSTSPRTTTLGAGQELSAFLDQSPFNGSKPFLGTFTFSSNVPVAALGLKGYYNERQPREFLFTTSPVSPLGAVTSSAQSGDETPQVFAASTDAAVIPLYASGGGWTTDVVLTNTTDSAESGTLQFVAQDGGPAPTVVDGLLNTTFNYVVPPRGAVRMVAANTGNTTAVGSIRVTPSASTGMPFATAIFSYKVAGLTVSQSSVSASPRSNAYRLYVERSLADSTRSGVAIANASDGPVSVDLELLQMDGQRVGLQTLPALPANGQVSKFIDELFTSLPPTFRGTLRVTAPSLFGGASLVVTGIRSRNNERNDFLFAATPASDETAAAYNGMLVFTHVINGDGYTTQLILFSDSSGATGGSLTHLSKDGVQLSSGGLHAQP